jgi:hypothetical protein
LNLGTPLSLSGDPTLLVNFGINNANPADFPPGGNGNPYNFNATLNLGAINPGPQNGIAVGQSLTAFFNANPDSVIAALNDGSLRIGLHVQSIDGGGSDGFLLSTDLTVDPGPTVVPVRPTLALLASVGPLVYLGRVLRRRKEVVA